MFSHCQIFHCAFNKACRGGGARKVFTDTQRIKSPQFAFDKKGRLLWLIHKHATTLNLYTPSGDIPRAFATWEAAQSPDPDLSRLNRFGFALRTTEPTNAPAIAAPKIVHHGRERCTTSNSTL